MSSGRSPQLEARSCFYVDSPLDSAVHIQRNEMPMNDEIDRLIDQKLHEEIVKALHRPATIEQDSRHLAQPEAESKAINVSRDIAPYLARVQRMGETLKQAKSREQEMEQLVHDLQARQMELEAGLEQVTRRIGELEEAVATDQYRATRAQTMAASAVKRVEELDRALTSANTTASASEKAG